MLASIVFLLLTVWLKSGQWFFTSIIVGFLGFLLFWAVCPNSEKDFYSLLRGKDVL